MSGARNMKRKPENSKGRERDTKKKKSDRVMKEKKIEVDKKWPVTLTATNQTVQQLVVGESEIKNQMCFECKGIILKEQSSVKCIGGCKRIFHHHGSVSSIKASRTRASKTRVSIKSCIQSNSKTFTCDHCSKKEFKCVHCDQVESVERNLIECTAKGGLKHFFHTQCKEVQEIQILAKLKKDQEDGKINQKKYTKLEKVITKKTECLCQICHTCIGSENIDERLNGVDTWSSTAKKILRCTECTATYHNEHRCVPVGSKPLCGNWIICPLHEGKDTNMDEGKDTNIDEDTKMDIDEKDRHEPWFACDKEDGDVVHCSRCAASFHEQCGSADIMSETNIFGTVNEGRLCKNCQMARQPIRGDVVRCFTDDGWKFAKVLPIHHLKEEREKCGRIRVQLLDKPQDTLVRVQTNCLLYNEETEAYFKSNNDDDKKEAQEILKRNNTADLGTVNCAKLLKPGTYAWTDVPQSHNDIQLPRSADEDVQCVCTPEHPCNSEGDGCEAFAVRVECTAACNAKKQCGNRSIQKRIVPEFYLCHFGKTGYGLVASESIKKDVFIGEYTGEIIDQEEKEKRNQSGENTMFYCHEIQNGIYIDANPCGNHTRFLNHSCDPNTQANRWSVDGNMRIGIYAIKDIGKDEQVTLKYLDDSFNVKCSCGEKNCMSNKDGNDEDI